MSWSVGVVENSLELTEASINALIECRSFQYLHDTNDKDELRECGFEENSLYLSEDWYEHIDILASNPEFVTIIEQNGGTGDVCFGSLEGDNSGSFWGYRFKDGKCIPLHGTIVYQEV